MNGDKEKSSKILRNLGFSEKEIVVYFALLKNNTSPPSVLSKITNISRPSIYNILKNLQSRGVVTEDLSKKTINFKPLPVENLKSIITKDRIELNRKERLIKGAIAELSLITIKENYLIPKIRFVEEENLEKFLYENIEKWQKMCIDENEAVWGFQDEKFANVFKEWIEYGWNTVYGRDKKYRVCHLTNASDFEYGMEGFLPTNKRQIKFVNGINFTSTCWIAGDYLVMVSIENKPFYIFEIKDKVLAHNMREIIKKLWDSSK